MSKPNFMKLQELEEKVEELENEIEEIKEQNKQFVKFKDKKEKGLLKKIEELENIKMMVDKQETTGFNVEEIKKQLEGMTKDIHIIKKFKNDKYEEYKEKIEKLEENLDVMGDKFMSASKDWSDEVVKNQKYEGIINQLTIGIILTNNVDEYQEQIELTNPKSKRWKKGFDKEQVKLYETILEKLNESDWNEDKCNCQLVYNKKDKSIDYIMNDDEETDEEIHE